MLIELLILRYCNPSKKEIERAQESWVKLVQPALTWRVEALIKDIQSEEGKAEYKKAIRNYYLGNE